MLQFQDVDVFYGVIQAIRGNHFFIVLDLSRFTSGNHIAMIEHNDVI